MSSNFNSPQNVLDHVRRVHGPLSCSLGSSNRLPRPARATNTWRGVFFEGPKPAQDREGEEIPIWLVYVGDEDAKPLGRVYQCFSFAMADRLAQRMAKDPHLELIQEAMRA